MKRLSMFKSSTSLVSMFGCATIALGGPAHAADTSWLPTAASTDWFDSANWDAGVPDSNTGFTFIDAIGANSPVLDGVAQTGAIDIGENGAGKLTIRDGGHLQSLDAELGVVLGYDSGSEGTVTVDGVGSLWDLPGGTSLVVGTRGTGTLVVSNGGKVVASGIGGIGADEGGQGIVTVDGAGSAWEMTEGEAFGIGVRDNSSGSLVVSNGGNVTSVISYLGYGVNSKGTVTIDGAGSTWKIVRGTGSGGLAVGDDGDLTVGNDSSGSLIVANDGIGNLTLKNGGSLVAEDTVNVAAQEQSIGVVNIGAAEGEPAAVPGLLSAASFTFGAGAGRLVFNHTSADYTFDAPISGRGTIKQLAGTTILTGDSSGFTGNTHVVGGVLQVDGLLGGTLDVFANAKLQGAGTVGSTVIESGGTLSPGGGAIDTMTVAGDLIFRGGSTYLVNANPAGKGDLTNVSGTVTVNGGNVEVEAADGSYQPNTTYTILRAQARAGNGAFTTSTKLAFLTPTLSWSEAAGNSALILSLARNDKTVTSVAKDGGGGAPGEVAVAGAIDQLNAGNGVYDALMGMSVEDALRTLQLSSGESHVSYTQVIDETSGLFTRSLLGRTGGAGAISTGVGANGSEAGYVETPVMTAATAAISGIVTPKRDPQRVAWFAPIGARGHFEGDGNASETDWTTGGMTAGYEFSETMGGGDFLGGIAAGYLHTYAKSDENLTSARFDGGQLGFYGRWKGGPVTVSGAIAGGVIQTRTDRQIKVANLDLTAKSTGWSNTLNASTEVSYAVPMGSDFMLSPLATLATAFVHRNSTSESGADAFNLDVDSSSHAELTPGLGVELTHESDVEGGVVSTRIRTVWEHTIGDDVSQTMNFAGADAAQFSVKAPDAARDRLRLGLGITYATKGNWSLFADYEGVFSATDTHHAARAGAKLTF
ncbi:autotransporter domain-containing protein [Rhizobium sp. RAF56]|uniref:autotransporter family protein n=1 Tax=Rhizobium sp. RAF56 TaxID=3233062 RepID=UPI003F9D3381